MINDIRLDLTFSANNQVFNLSDIQSVWFRRGHLHIFSAVSLDTFGDTKFKRGLGKHLEREDKTLLDFIYQQLKTKKSLNHPSVYNMNKLIGLDMAMKAGLKVPNTLVTTSTNDLKHFNQQQNQIITKNIQDVLSVATTKYSAGQGTAGLALRHIDATTAANNKRFGGFITLGTPQDGLFLSDATINGDLTAYQADADQLDVTNYYNIPFSPTVTVNGKNWKIDYLGDYAKNFHEAYITSPSNVNQTAIDIRTNSSFISNLPSSINKPMINIYGNELTKSQWRTMSSHENRPHTLNLDEQGVEDVLMAANQLDIAYRNRIILFSGVTLVCAVGTIVTAAATIGAAIAVPPAAPGVVFAGLLVTTASTAVTVAAIGSISHAVRVRNWLRDSETKWKRLIGAIRTQTSTYTYTGMSQFCIDQIAQFGWGWYYGNSANQQLCYGNPTTVTFTQFINEQSDGVVPKSSTQLANATSLEAFGANHFELYNHPSVKDRFTQIFGGAYGNFFFIP